MSEIETYLAHALSCCLLTDFWSGTIIITVTWLAEGEALVTWDTLVALTTTDVGAASVVLENDNMWCIPGGVF